MSRLLFIDTETGGTDPAKHSLLSVGIVVWDNQLGECFSDEYRLKSKEYHITKSAQRINKIIDPDSTNAVSGKTIIEKISRIKKEYFTEYNGIPLAGHNTQFDVSFLKKMYKDNHRSYEKSFSHRIVDTYSIIKFLCDTKVIETSISSSAQAFKYFGISVDGRHTALGDAQATMQLYEKMLQLIEFKLN